MPLKMNVNKLSIFLGYKKRLLIKILTKDTNIWCNLPLKTQLFLFLYAQEMRKIWIMNMGRVLREY